MTIQGTKHVNEIGAVKKPRLIEPCASKKIESTLGRFFYIKRKVTRVLGSLPVKVRGHLIDNFVADYEGRVKTFKNKKRIHLKGGLEIAFKRLEERASQLKVIFADSPFAPETNEYKLVYCAGARKEYALNIAELCHKNVVQLSQVSAFQECEYEETIIKVYECLLNLVSPYKVKEPYPLKRITWQKAESGVLRLCCDKFWKRHFEKVASRVREHIQIAMGFVSKKTSAYVSKLGMGEYKAQQRAQENYLKNTNIVNASTGEKFNLHEVWLKSSSNPVNRHNELMVQADGMESSADALGYIGLFLTITSPSKYHRNSTKWNGANPSDTRDYFQQMWSRARSALQKKNIHYFGLRVCEPHADGTPHWHMLVFVHPSQATLLKTIIRSYAVAEETRELVDIFKARTKKAKTGKIFSRGRRVHWYSPRFDVEEIDKSKGSAVSYILKYISKNINSGKDSANLEEDFETGKSIGSSLSAVRAWASKWSIRQFQFFGGAPISVWREMRRLKDALTGSLELIRNSADNNDWNTFAKLTSEFGARLAFEEGQNDYDEAVKKVTGVQLATGEEIKTRLEVYTLERASVQEESACAPWSSVNNCTAGAELADSMNIKTKNYVNHIGLDDEMLGHLARGASVKVGQDIFQIKSGVLTQR